MAREWKSNRFTSFVAEEEEILEKAFKKEVYRWACSPLGFSNPYIPIIVRMTNADKMLDALEIEVDKLYGDYEDEDE